MVKSPREGGLSERLFDALIDDFPDHRPGTRPVHAVGIGADGYFVPSHVARRFTTADHFQGDRVQVTVRFSNGSGSPVENDPALDIRGMATKFLLPSGPTDLIMSSLPVFFSRTSQDFLDFAGAGEPKPVKALPRWSCLTDRLRLRQPRTPPGPDTPDNGVAGVIAYADDHPFARAGTIAALTQPAPTSYARVTYHAIHTFRLTDPDGNVHYCRFTWEPVAGVRPETRSGLPEDYLHTELKQRLMRAPVRFVLRAVVGGQGDALDDPTVGWDTTRLRLVMGELVLTELAEEGGGASERLSFNPTRVMRGFEVSGDLVLAARGAAYEYSCLERGGVGCQLGRGR